MMEVSTCFQVFNNGYSYPRTGFHVIPTLDPTFAFSDPSIRLFRHPIPFFNVISTPQIVFPWWPNFEWIVLKNWKNKTCLTLNEQDFFHFFQSNSVLIWNRPQKRVSKPGEGNFRCCYKSSTIKRNQVSRKISSVWEKTMKNVWNFWKYGLRVSSIFTL